MCYRDCTIKAIGTTRRLLANLLPGIERCSNLSNLCLSLATWNNIEATPYCLPHVALCTIVKTGSCMI